MSTTGRCGIKGATPRAPLNIPPRSGTMSTGPRRVASTPRGVTPSRNRNQNQGSTSDAEIAPGIPRLNLTEEEELEILERLESGKYVGGAGLAQFISAPPQPSSQSKPKCQQNLLGAFASLDKQADDAFVVDKTADTLGKLQLEDKSLKRKEDNYRLPEHCKKLDLLMETVGSYKKVMNETVEGIFEARFAELFPTEMLQSVKNMENAATVLQNFLNENTSDNVMLFFPSRKKDKALLPCPIEEQEEVIEIIYSLSQLLEKFHQYLNSPNKDINLESMIQNFADSVDKFESDLKEGKASVAEAEKLFKFFQTLSPSLSLNSSGISFNDVTPN